MAVMGQASREQKDHLQRALGGFRGAAVSVFVISGVVNLLALTGAFYMLQIYDRALTSQSVPTLLALSALAIVLYLFQGLLDITRSQVLIRLGAQLDLKLAPLAHKVVVDMPRYGFSSTEAMARGRDVDTLRQFISGQGLIALFDIPWTPVFLVFVYLLHPWLGILVFAGAIILAGLTLAAELLTRDVSSKVHEAAIKRMTIADANTKNADVLRALGMTARAIKRYDAANARHLRLQTQNTDIGGTLSGLSKVFRMMLQSAVLGLGAFLAIQGELSAGAIIAASVVAARALAPVDLAISQWKLVVSARNSFRRLKETLATLDDRSALVQLPPPVESVSVEGITVAAPQTGSIVLSDVTFDLKQGDALGLIGPSGSGKSSLAKALTGVWPLVRGSVRLDHADLSQWHPDDLGQYIGYLPQEVSLMDGSIAENIARFEDEASDEQVIKAARDAGVHELIVRLPDGYQTVLGSAGTALSAGQRQRIALARALYRDPFLVVLDEPNSNLDAEGDKALTQAILNVKKRGGIVVIIAHRPSALAAVDLVGVVQNGRLVSFGPKDEIIAAGAPPRKRMRAA